MKKNNKIKSIIYAGSMLSGTVIGVGMLSLPYLTVQVGWTLILSYFILVGLPILLLHVLFGEIVVKTPDHKRLPGISEFYWGRSGKNLSLATHSFALLGSILAYTIVGGTFLSELFRLYGIDLTLLAAVLFFSALGGLVILIGSSALNKIQFAGIIGFALVITALAWIGRHEISIAGIFARNGDQVSWFAPYGAIIFSFWGLALIPQVEDILGRHKHLITKVITASIALPALVYIAFIAIILGISGTETAPSALVSLKDHLGPGAEALILIFGLITTFTSFVSLGLTLTQVLEFDLKINRIKAWLAVLLLPPALYLCGIKDFLDLIIFMGAVLFALDGINILLIYRKALPKAKPWKRSAAVIIIIMLFCGIAYEISALAK